MVMCNGGNAHMIEADFISAEAWEAWLAKEHPRLLEDDHFRADYPSWRQRGTNYYWSRVDLVDAPTIPN